MSSGNRTGQCGIYQIRNTVNRKVYIGSAVNLRRRWARHRDDLRCGAHHSIRLQRSWNKYGSDAFVFEILELVSEMRHLISVEQAHLDRTNSFNPRLGYNMSPTAGSSLGVRQTDDQKSKTSQIMKNYMQDPNVRSELAIKCSGWSHTPEAREKIGASHRGRKHSSEWIANMKAADRTFSPEAMVKLRAIGASKQRPQTEPGDASQEGRIAQRPRGFP
jgi:group I intron endonuclease